MSNTVLYGQIYDDVLQDRLDLPRAYDSVCDVIYTNERAIISNYESTQPSVQTVSRGTAFSIQDFVQSADTLTISTGRDLATYVDFADQAQSPWSDGAEQFNRIGARLKEFIESDVLGRHASWTDFGLVSIGGGGSATDQITVSAANIDNIVRGVQREIREANGQFLWDERGAFVVWRAADFEYLEEFTQANGFMNADKALRDGQTQGLKYLGNMNHYWSTSHATNHLFAGVKKVEKRGILTKTFGRAHTIEFPAGSSNNNLSGTAYYSRVDTGGMTPSGHSSILFDINVV